MKRYAIVVAVLAVTGSVCAQAVQWTEAEGGNGHWYAVVPLGSGFEMNWYECRESAQNMGGDLVSLETLDEWEWYCVVTQCGPDAGPGGPIGLFQPEGSSEPGGGWQWLTDVPLEYDRWRNPDEPDNVEGSDHGIIIPGWNQTPYNALSDKVWSATHSNFFVEWSTDCNGDGIVDYGQILDGTYADDDGNGVPDCCDAGEPCDAVQWIEADGGNGHWYSYRLGDLNNAAWTALAEAEGAHLVTITSEAEGVFVEAVHDAAAPQSAYHTGGFQDTSAPDYAEPDGGWRWVTGEPWQYTNWGYSDGADQPDNLPDGGEGANIMGIRWQENGIWLDMSETTEWAAMFEWSADCNGDGIIDFGQILDGTYADDDGNGVPDCCELPGGCEDCNDNGVLDSEDLVNGTSQDCNANDIPDECESLADCDGDGTSDACEILGGALDVNPADGVPDECQGLPAGACCVNGACMMGTAASCFAAEGSYAGDGVSCADAGCPADCPTDVFEDGVTDINDLLLILSEFGSVCP